MPEFRLTRRADADIAGVADYTIEQFGIKQSHRYADALNTCFQNVAKNPQLGRRIEQLAPNLRRFQYQSHIVFYVPHDDGVLIIRVPHKSVDTPRHL